MAGGSEYVSGWKRCVVGAIRSYKDVLENLIDGRDYHGGRSFSPPDDMDADHRRAYVEVPLLWGTF